MFDRLIHKHPRDIGETYTEHANHALYIGARLLLAGGACLVHALLPGLCVRTASNAVDDITSLMGKRMNKSDHLPVSGPGPATMIENPSN